MVMPVRQRCPKCGDMFMGSDSIGGSCLLCLASNSMFFKPIDGAFVEPLKRSIDGGDKEHGVDDKTTKNLKDVK